MDDRRFFKGAFAQEMTSRIEEASGPGGIVRWDGMRRLGGAFADTGLRIPLDNDGTLHQQLCGLTHWCARFADKFGISDEDAPLIALAYVARQVGGSNYLLNNQSDATRSAEGEKLSEHAAQYCPCSSDTKTCEVFDNVAAALKKDPAQQKITHLLAAANAAFYIETGLAAVRWAQQSGAAWAEERANERPDLNRQDLIRETRHTAILLAANAWGNNAKILEKSDVLQVKSALANFRVALADQDMIGFATAIMERHFYKESLEKAAAAKPSADKTTSSRPTNGTQTAHLAARHSLRR